VNSRISKNWFRVPGFEFGDGGTRLQIIRAKRADFISDAGKRQGEKSVSSEPIVQCPKSNVRIISSSRNPDGKRQVLNFGMQISGCKLEGDAAPGRRGPKRRQAAALQRRGGFSLLMRRLFPALGDLVNAVADALPLRRGSLRRRRQKLIAYGWRDKGSCSIIVSTEQSTFSWRNCFDCLTTSSFPYRSR
jgi:hypothetical protein